MSRHAWPPKYANVDIGILLDDKVSHGAFRFYSKLRALAGGQPSLKIDFSELMELSDLSQTRIYEYARLLRDRNGLLFHCAEGVFEYSFPELSQIPGKREKGIPGKRESSAPIPGKRELPATVKNPKNPPESALPVPQFPENGNRAPLKSLNTKSLKTKEDSKTAIPGKRESLDLFPLVEAMVEVCRIPLEANRGQLFAAAKLLAKINPTPTPELVRQHYNGNPACFWRLTDWRGKKGEDPTPAAIRQTWGKWGTRPDAVSRFKDY